jgi:uncharacterized protein YecT (DUF1311 family)
MTEPDSERGLQKPAQRLNWTTIALIGGLIVLVGIIAYFATNRNSQQDKLTDTQLGQAQPEDLEKRCASKATYDLIKTELFRRAAQLRGSDQTAYDKMSAYASLRMENPVMESEDSSTGAVNCSGSLSLDLPPGVAAVGGRRTLMSDIDYTVRPEADGNGAIVLLRNADAIIAPLATLARVARPAPEAAETNAVGPEQPEANVAASESASQQPGPASAYPGRPSFDCSKARSHGEIAVCSDGGLSALDLNMSTQYRRALAAANAQQQALLQSTGARFLAYRDRCPNRQCIADGYLGRMREIRDIMEGRLQPPR